MTQLEEYEEFLKKQPLCFMLDKTAEYDGVPPFAPVFNEDPWVSQADLWIKYLNRYRASIPDRAIPGLFARCYRTYPSLVRDYHLSLILKDIGMFDLVVRTDDLDKHGVDFLLFTDQEVYAVAAYLDSPRSRQFREKKRGKHIPLSPMTIELPLNMDEAHEVGKFSLYGPEHVARLWKAIREHRHKKTAA